MTLKEIIDSCIEEVLDSLCKKDLQEMRSEGDFYTETDIEEREAQCINDQALAKMQLSNRLGSLGDKTLFSNESIQSALSSYLFTGQSPLNPKMHQHRKDTMLWESLSLRLTAAMIASTIYRYDSSSDEYKTQTEIDSDRNEAENNAQKLTEILLNSGLFKIWIANENREHFTNIVQELSRYLVRNSLDEETLNCKLAALIEQFYPSPCPAENSSDPKESHNKKDHLLRAKRYEKYKEVFEIIKDTTPIELSGSKKEFFTEVSCNSMERTFFSDQYLPLENALLSEIPLKDYNLKPSQAITKIIKHKIATMDEQEAAMIFLIYQACRSGLENELKTYRAEVKQEMLTSLNVRRELEQRTDKIVDWLENTVFKQYKTDDAEDEVKGLRELVFSYLIHETSQEYIMDAMEDVISEDMDPFKREALIKTIADVLRSYDDLKYALHFKIANLQSSALTQQDPSSTRQLWQDRIDASKRLTQLSSLKLEVLQQEQYHQRKKMIDGAHSHAAQHFKSIEDNANKKESYATGTPSVLNQKQRTEHQNLIATSHRAALESFKAMENKLIEERNPANTPKLEQKNRRNPEKNSTNRMLNLWKEREFQVKQIHNK